MDRKEFGHRLQTARKSRKITAEKLAEMCGISVGAVAKIEGGKNVPRLELLLKMCNILEISPVYLMARDLESCRSLEKNQQYNRLCDCLQKADDEQIAKLVSVAEILLK